MKCWWNVVKKTFRDQVFTTFNNLPKAIRIIDNKKENQKILYRQDSCQNFASLILYNILLF